MPSFAILPRPQTLGGLRELTQEGLIAERRNILDTWATLFVQTAGRPKIEDLDTPARQSKKDTGNTKLERGVYLFHAFAGTKARLVGGLRPMSHCQGALACKLAGQCWFNASCMGALEHVFDQHESAIAAHEALSIAIIGPGAANNYYAKMAGMDTPPDRPALMQVPPLILVVFMLAVFRESVYRAFETLQWVDDDCSSLGPDTMVLTIRRDAISLKWSAEIISDNILPRADQVVAAASSHNYFTGMPSRGCAGCRDRRTDITRCPRCSLRGSLARVLMMFDPPIKIDRNINFDALSA